MGMSPKKTKSGYHGCRNVGDKSDHGERNSGTRSSDDKFSRQAGLSLEKDVAERQKQLKNWFEDHLAVITCSGDQKGGGGQVQNTTSSPQNTVTTSGTQSTGTSISNTAGGVGGSDPPEDGRGKPPIPGHYRDHHGEDQGEDESDNEDGFENTPLKGPEVSDDETAESNEEIPEASNGETGGQAESVDVVQNPGIDAGVTCSWCNGPPKTIQLYFTAEVSGDVWTAIGVYCSQECAENGRSGKQLIISVNLWDTDSSSLRMCLVCDEFKWTPLAVCWECRAFMCGKCGQRSTNVKESIQCLFRCRQNSDIIIVFLPACIAGPAQLRTIDLSSQGRDRQLNGELIQELRQHGRQQLEDENRRLDEMNELQDLFSTEEDQRSRPLVVEHLYVSLPPMFERESPLSSYIADESENHGTASEPPTEDFDPSVIESAAQQEIEDPVAEEDVSELESHQPQEAPTILPAPKESEVEDGDEGVEVNFTE